MAVPLDSTSQPSAESERLLRTMELEHKRDKDERITGWTVIWVLFAFKMGTVALIWWTAQGSREEGQAAHSLLAATTWYYAVVPIVAVSGIVGYRLRLRAARKRVEQLRRAEFMESQDAAQSGTMTVELTDEEKARLRSIGLRREHGG
jgi:hypothetical protein